MLFLGLDGVMHHHNAKVAEFLWRMPLLERTVGQAQVDLVLLSCWDFASDLERTKAVFPAGLRSLVVGRTTQESGALYKRFKEIQNWLRANPVTDWRALDSDPLDYPDACSELIRCSPAIGLSVAQVESLNLWLQNPKAG
ncbi:MAG: HAD domain-containing protein [Rubrivivax sp.]